MAKTRSVSPADRSKAARGSGRPKPPASCRYFSTMSCRAGDGRGAMVISGIHILNSLDPNVGARFAVGYVDVKQIGLRNAGEALEQFSRAVIGAKRLGTRQ